MENEVDKDMQTDEVDGSVLDMSDEEFMKQGGAASVPAPKAETTTDKDKQNQAADQDTKQGDAAAAEVAGEGGEGQGDPDKTKQEDPAGKEAGKVRNDKGQFTKQDGEETKDSKAAEEDPARKDAKVDDKATDTGAVNYEALYKQITAPFKANGRDIQVESPEEAIRLMQMGANYNKKMAALKPNLALMKMLENNGLLNADKIGFLIDLDKKNPEAISKLVKDSGIDPLDISAEKAGGYTPGKHRVNDVEVELDQVLDELKDAPKLNETLDLVGTQWDAKSKGLVAANPQVLKVINTHMQNGIYDLVANEMTRQQALGQLSGLSDLEAYRQVGDAMASEGKFAHLFKQPDTVKADDKGSQAPAAKTVIEPKPKKADDSKREEQRRAAAPARGTAPSNKVAADFNPLALSDEEFAKFKPNFK